LGEAMSSLRRIVSDLDDAPDEFTIYAEGAHKRGPRRAR